MTISPYINRFIQPDSIIPDPVIPQTWNRYSYVNNSPINFSDPTGHDAYSTCGGNTSCMSYVSEKRPDMIVNPPDHSPCAEWKGLNRDICERGEDKPKHDYTTGPNLVCPAELHCTRDEMEEYLTRFAYPGQDPSQPVYDLETNSVSFCTKVLCIPMGNYGRIWTDISDDHLTVTNHTIRPHVFSDGQVVRTLQQAENGAWYVTSHSTGTHIYPFMAEANQWQGPDIFNDVDQAMLEYILTNH